MAFYEYVSNSFSIELFQKYGIASVCEWLAFLFKTQKNQSCFIF